MQLMTMAIIVFCFGLLFLGLHQSMHNSIIPLRLKNILTAPSIFNKNNKIGLSIMQSLISNAIKRLYTAGIDFVFRDNNCYFKMPSMHCLNINQTKFWQFGAIFKNKGTIEGTYGVHKSIFLDQLSLHAPENPTEAGPIYNNFHN